MNYQTLLVALTFILALIYLGRMFYFSMKKKENGCGGNCKCDMNFEAKKPSK